MSLPRILILGGRSQSPTAAGVLGWHLSELQSAARSHGAELGFADYESLTAEVGDERSRTFFPNESPQTDPPSLRLEQFDAVFTRTMPPGTMEQITFRLATLHDEYYRRVQLGRGRSFINPPAALELAIDKYATLTRVARMGILTPATVVTQSRGEAMRAFEKLGGDVVVKPIFGGEGRGVMRVRDAELAWTTFSTLQQLGNVFYVQAFVSPGGRDLRLLVIGDQMHAVRRTSTNDFRTNVRAGGRSELIEMNNAWRDLARRVCDEFRLTIAAIDLIETDNGNDYRFVEVNAIPGWKSAQSVVKQNIAEQIISVLKQHAV